MEKLKQRVEELEEENSKNHKELSAVKSASNLNPQRYTKTLGLEDKKRIRELEALL